MVAMLAMVAIREDAMIELRTVCTASTSVPGASRKVGAERGRPIQARLARAAVRENASWARAVCSNWRAMLPHTRSHKA